MEGRPAQPWIAAPSCSQRTTMGYFLSPGSPTRAVLVNPNGENITIGKSNCFRIFPYRIILILFCVLAIRLSGIGSRSLLLSRKKISRWSPPSDVVMPNSAHIDSAPTSSHTENCTDTPHACALVFVSNSNYVWVKHQSFASSKFHIFVNGHFRLFYLRYIENFSST